MAERKKQLTIDGVLVDFASFIHGPPVQVHEQTLELRDSEHGFQPMWVQVESRKFRSDYGSRIVAEAMAPYKRHWLAGFYERLSEVLAKNRDYILGQEGVAAIEEAAEDRRLVEAIARGAVVNPETGLIVGFDR